MIRYGLVIIAGLAISSRRRVPGGAESRLARAAIDRDLLDVTVPQLHRLYAEKKYTVTQVVQWHLDRIDRYNGVYGAIETVFRREALAEAARRTRRRREAVRRRALWGVPIVIKANTSIKGR
jgi:Asp-tRNA(Asn)/Glu-tRNA(Gln) amidotransferase A subunit family amidase